MRVLVTGATGFIGSRLVDILSETDHEVTVLTRDTSSYDGPDTVTLVEGDILEPGSFEDALDVDAAYYLIHSLGSGMDFAERDRTAAENFARAASDADLSRVIYLGGLGDEGDNSSSDEEGNSPETTDLSKHLASRREVERVLREGEYDLTTLRAAIIIGEGSESFQMIEQLVQRLPVMITPKWVRTRCQPIAVTDVIKYLVGVLETPETVGETYQIGGPEEITYQELLKQTANVMGRRLYILPVPVLTPRLSTYWVELVTDVPKSIARPLILGQKNTVVVDSHRIEELIPIELTAYETAIERAYPY